MVERRPRAVTHVKALTTINGREGQLQVDRHGAEWTYRYQSEGLEYREHTASLIEVESAVYSILVDGRSYLARVTPAGDGYSVTIDGRRYSVELRDPRAFHRKNHSGMGEGRQTVAAPMPGKVVRVLVNEGDIVDAGAGLVVVEAMKMQNEMKAPKAGKVVALAAKAGATVGAGDVLVAIE